MKKHSFGKKVLAVVSAAALCAVAVMGLTGCSDIQKNLGIVSNSDPTVALNCTLPSGSTITDGVLTVGINTSNSPYGGTNASGEVIGLDVDVSAALADNLGCKVKVVDVGTDGKTALSKGKVDVIMGANMSGSDASVSYTSAYLNDGVSLFCLVKNAPDSVDKADFSKGKVLVQAGSAAALEMQDALGVEGTTECSTMQEAFEALEAGKSKFLAANAVIGDYYARDYKDVVRVNFLSANDVTPVYAATAADNTTLSTAVNTAMSSITTDGNLRIVAAKWLGDQGSTLLPGALDVTSLPETFTPKKKESKKSK